MIGAFNRDLLPSWEAYAYAQGLVLEGKGKWRNVLCDFHADSRPSLRVNMQSGGWVCMSGGAKGGDVLSHYMQRANTGFAEAAQDLGAWGEGKLLRRERKPRSLSSSDAMQVVAVELLTLIVSIADARQGIIPTDGDWLRSLTAAGRIETLALEFHP